MLFFIQWFRRILKMNSAVLVTFSAGLIVAASFAAYALEPGTFKHPFNGFWWVMTTVTTVGYGDFYPHTVPGKVLGVLLYMFGISLISIVISRVVDGVFIYKRKKEEGRLRYRGEGHFVIIDWSKHAELAVQEILNTDPNADIVLIDQYEKTPCEHDRVHYVRGNPVRKETLDNANLEQARAVFIFANEIIEYNKHVRDDSFVDGKSLLTATAIERHFSHIHTVVEVVDRDHIQNFQHVKVDEFIVSTETVSRLAVRAAFNPGVSKIVYELLSRGQGEDLYEIRPRTHWVTYRDAYMELLQQGATLIADGDKLDINRRLDEPIPATARLFVICDYATYTKL